MLRYAPPPPDNTVNELDAIINQFTPTMNTLNTQSQVLDAVRAHKYLVLSSSKEGDMSVAQNPVAHTSEESARKECQRLARISPGKAFIIVELTGAELIPTNNISI